VGEAHFGNGGEGGWGAPVQRNKYPPGVKKKVGFLVYQEGRKGKRGKFLTL